MTFAKGRRRVKKRWLAFMLLSCLTFLAALTSVNGADITEPLTYQTQKNGTVLFYSDYQNIGFVLPEITTGGGEFHSFDGQSEEDGFPTDWVDLGSGVTVHLQVNVVALPQGLRINYVLVPEKTVEVQQVRASIYLPYSEWQKTPYRLGPSGGEISMNSAGGSGITIARAEGQPLTLGPSPALGGLQILMYPGTATLTLADNSQWTSDLEASVTLNKLSKKPWIWKAGQAKKIGFDLTFNRGLSPVPIPTPADNYGMDSPNSTFIPADDPRIQYSGRFDFSNPRAPRFQWPAVSIKAVFQGTSIGILLDDCGFNYFDAFIDGKLQRVIEADQSLQYRITDLKPGTHTLLLVRRTESAFGISTFKGFLLEKGATLLKPPPLPSRRIEIVGDCNATGYGVEATSTNCDSLHIRSTEEAYWAFGSLAARALDAEVRVTSYSGTGMLGKWGEANLARPAYYQRVLPHLESPVMDPKQWVPDAVVIESGGADTSSDGTIPNPGEVEEAYKNFISVLRADYPKAHLYCMIFRTSPPLRNLVQDLVTQENKAGDSKVGLIVVDLPTVHLTGCGEHIDLVGQRQMGDEVAKALGKDMGWKVDDSTFKAAGDEIPPPP